METRFGGPGASTPAPAKQGAGESPVGDGEPQKVLELGKITQFLITKTPLYLGQHSACGKVFPLWNWVCPLPRGRPSGSKPAAQRPFLSSCLLFWLNTAGSSTWASCLWHGYPPLPQPCLSPSSALRVGYDPVADPKDWSQPGGENWLQSGGRNACIL